MNKYSHILNSAAEEITRLRRENEILGAKCDVLEIFSAATRGPRQPSGMSPDVVWALRQAAEQPEAQSEVSDLTGRAAEPPSADRWPDPCPLCGKYHPAPIACPPPEPPVAATVEAL